MERDRERDGRREAANHNLGGGGRALPGRDEGPKHDGNLAVARHSKTGSKIF